MRRRKIVGLRLHDTVEHVTLEQEQHPRGHRREHSQKKHEDDSAIVHKKRLRRQRRIHLSETNESQRHGGR